MFLKLWPFCSSWVYQSPPTQSFCASLKGAILRIWHPSQPPSLLWYAVPHMAGIDASIALWDMNAWEGSVAVMKEMQSGVRRASWTEQDAE